MDKFENVRDVLMYATNADKTEKTILCDRNKLQKWRMQQKEMEFVKIINGKTDRILAFHGEQSF